jgi:hypothetical protein
MAVMVIGSGYSGVDPPTMPQLKLSLLSRRKTHASLLQVWLLSLSVLLQDVHRDLDGVLQQVVRGVVV